MGTTNKKLSIDGLARRLREEFCGGDLWAMCSAKTKGTWRRIARLARKLEAQPASKPQKGKLFCVCVDRGAFEKLRKHATKAAAKKARK